MVKQMLNLWNLIWLSEEVILLEINSRAFKFGAQNLCELRMQRFYLTCNLNDGTLNLYSQLTAGLSNLQPTDRMRPARQLCAAREAIYFYNELAESMK